MKGLFMAHMDLPGQGKQGGCGFQRVSELGQDSGAVCSAAEWTPPGDGVPPTTVSHLSRSSP